VLHRTFSTKISSRPLPLLPRGPAPLANRWRSPQKEDPAVFMIFSTSYGTFFYPSFPGGTVGGLFPFDDHSPSPTRPFRFRDVGPLKRISFSCPLGTLVKDLHDGLSMSPGGAIRVISPCNGRPTPVAFQSPPFPCGVCCCVPWLLPPSPQNIFFPPLLFSLLGRARTTNNPRSGWNQHPALLPLPLFCAIPQSSFIDSNGGPPSRLRETPIPFPPVPPFHSPATPHFSPNPPSVFPTTLFPGMNPSSFFCSSPPRPTRSGRLPWRVSCCLSRFFHSPRGPLSQVS